MANRFPLLLLLGLAACGRPDAAQQSAAAPPAEATPASAASEATAPAAPASDVALTHANGFIVSGDKHPNRTTYSLPNASGTNQLMGGQQGGQPEALASIIVTSDDASRGFRIFVTVPGRRSGTFALGPNQPARVILGLDDLSATYGSYESGASGTLTVTKFADGGKAVAGTFSGEFADVDGRKLTVHEGRFGADQLTVVGQ